MRKLCLYFHTVRHLRLSQIAARISYRLHHPRPDLREAPGVRDQGNAFVEPIAMKAAMVGPATFRFLNVERSCITAADWTTAHVDKLWIYNLHYFDDLNATGARERREWHQSLMARWIAENPPGEGDGWEPYPVSRRIINWIKWAMRGNALSPQVQCSLAVQVRWLMQRIEFHLLGNHLFMNAKALLHAGLFFSGPEAERWYATGARIAARELVEQVLPDGGHFELSTMYHAAMLEDMLDLVNLHRAYAVPPPLRWVHAVSQMRHWMNVMTHPDGGIAFFNDSAFEIAPTEQQLRQYADRLHLRDESPPVDSVMILESSGYVRMQANAAVLFCDVASVGPTYQPGHAHADTLSFEFSLGVERIFVNSGTSVYGIDQERQRQRGTAAHNTVVVDGQNSSEVWAGFRVARRAEPTLRSLSRREPHSLEASHNGYRRLRGRNDHVRRWTIDRTELRIDDRVTGDFTTAVAYFHLHPAVKADLQTGNCVRLVDRENRELLVEFSGAAGIEIRDGTWHPEFGVALTNRCIVATFSRPELVTRVTWARPA